MNNICGNSTDSNISSEWERNDDNLAICKFVDELVKSTQDNSNLTRALHFMLTLTSLISLTIVVNTVRNNKNLRAHPSFLIAFICTCEACFVFTAFISSPNVNSAYWVCYFNLDKLFKVTTFLGLACNKYDIEFFTWTGFWMLGFLQLASLLSNLCLCHDLIRTLQSPFDVASARLKWYIGYSLLIPMIIMILVFQIGSRQNKLLNI